MSPNHWSILKGIFFLKKKRARKTQKNHVEHYTETTGVVRTKPPSDNQGNQFRIKMSSGQCQDQIPYKILCVLNRKT